MVMAADDETELRAFEGRMRHGEIGRERKPTHTLGAPMVSLESDFA